jgi:hypothetical protein
MEKRVTSVVICFCHYAGAGMLMAENIKRENLDGQRRKRLGWRAGGRRGIGANRRTAKSISKVTRRRYLIADNKHGVSA